jgi:hypothetical protein
MGRESRSAHAEVASINQGKRYFVQRWIRNPKMKSKILVVDDAHLEDLRGVSQLIDQADIRVRGDPWMDDCGPGRIRMQNGR